jgi:hypothetical protein
VKTFARKDVIMTRKLFALLVALGLTAFVGERAQAAVIYPIFVGHVVYYQPAPPPVVYVQTVQPVVAFEPGARYVAAHDMQGVVTYFNRFNMTVRINGGFYAVQLHQGTIINPTGTTLAPGMLVNVGGFWSGGVFYANAINVVAF